MKDEEKEIVGYVVKMYQDGVSVGYRDSRSGYYVKQKRRVMSLEDAQDVACSVLYKDGWGRKIVRVVRRKKAPEVPATTGSYYIAPSCWLDGPFKTIWDANLALNKTAVSANWRVVREIKG